MNLCKHFAIRCHFVICSFRLFIVFPLLLVIHSSLKKTGSDSASVITAIVLQFIGFVTVIHSLKKKISSKKKKIKCTVPIFACHISIRHTLSTFPSSLLIPFYFFSIGMAGKNLFSRCLIGILEFLDSCISEACFQFLSSLDDDERREPVLLCFQYPHLVLTSSGFPIKDLEGGVLIALCKPTSTELSH